MQQSPEGPLNERIRLNLMLADGAQVHEGKLFVMGGCVNARPANVGGLLAIAGTISVPWNDANRPHSMSIVLLAENQEQVPIQTPMGLRPFIVKANFEVGRPPGIPRGIRLLMPFAVQFALPGLPQGLYTFQFSIDETEIADAALTFWVQGEASTGS